MHSLAKKLVKGILYAGSAFSIASGCSRYVDRPNLEVNTGNRYCGVIWKSEEEGWKDLRKLAEEARTEEAWVYLPREKKWIEVGFEETPIEIYTSPLKIAGILRKHKEIVNYHLHPNLGKMPYSEVLFYARKNKEVISEEDWKKIKNESYFIFDAVPSSEDLAWMINFNSLFVLKGKDFVHTEKICSLYGISEYYLTEEGKKFYRGKGYYKALFDFRNPGSKYSPNNRLSLVWELKSKSLEERCGEYAKMLSDDKIIIRFKPHSSKRTRVTGEAVFGEAGKGK